MWALLMMWQCINEERGKMSFIGMTPPIYSYLDNLCPTCNLENNNRWNYALRVRCFIIVSNVFRWCVTRVHDICTETALWHYVTVLTGVLPVPFACHHYLWMNTMRTTLWLMMNTMHLVKTAPKRAAPLRNPMTSMLCASMVLLKREQFPSLCFPIPKIV
jgi:hypothetical protein